MVTLQLMTSPRVKSDRRRKVAPPTAWDPAIASPAAFYLSRDTAGQPIRLTPALRPIGGSGSLIGRSSRRCPP